MYAVCICGVVESKRGLMSWTRRWTVGADGCGADRMGRGYEGCMSLWDGVYRWKWRDGLSERLRLFSGVVEACAWMSTHGGSCSRLITNIWRRSGEHPR